jgi:hypothetical protein
MYLTFRGQDQLTHYLAPSVWVHGLHGGGAATGWGAVRAPLTAEDGTNTFGRGGFFLHGGKYPGSQGCIDVTSYDLMLFSYIQAYSDSDETVQLSS